MWRTVEVRVSVSEWRDERKTQLVITGFEDGEEELWAKEIIKPLEAGKVKNRLFLRTFRKECDHADALILAQKTHFGLVTSIAVR